MKAVMIYPSRLIVAAEVNDDVLAIQGAVGGYFEPVRTRFNCVGLVNEEGQRLGLPLNVIASALTHTNIVGNMLVFGPANAGGDLTDVPKDVAEYLVTIPGRMPKTAKQLFDRLFALD